MRLPAGARARRACSPVANGVEPAAGAFCAGGRGVCAARAWKTFAPGHAFAYRHFPHQGGRHAKTLPEPIRDPATDPLLTPETCVIVLIDYQPEQYRAITSGPHEEITLNAVALCKLAAAYDIPVVLSTVGVGMEVNEGTIAAIREALPGVAEIDRTGVNSWEDAEFRAAVEATGRRRVVIGGLWTEVCLACPVIDMLAAGYEVYPVADAVGGHFPGQPRPRLRPHDPGRRATRDRHRLRLRADAQLGARQFRPVPQGAAMIFLRTPSAARPLRVSRPGAPAGWRTTPEGSAPPLTRGSARGFRPGQSGFSRASISARRASRKGGSESRSPRASSGSSTANPGPSVAISNRLPPGSRK